jgi:predicted transcriptional regulator
MEDLSDFQRGHIVCVHSAEASVIKTAILLGASKAAVSKVMLAYMNHGKTTSTRRYSV